MHLQMIQLVRDASTPGLVIQRALLRVSSSISGNFTLNKRHFGSVPLILLDGNGVWYSKTALVRNTLASMMPDISRVAGLSQRYTNHYIRATSIQTLDRAGFEARHITRITGHKSESSIKRYSKRLSENTKRLMSNTLSKPTGALNRVVAQISHDETGGMQANHDVVNENDLRLDDLESIFIDENLFFEVQSSKMAANGTVNDLVAFDFVLL